MEDSDKCKGCSTIPDHCAIEQSICPCRTCLVKIMCEKVCDEWYELSSFWKKVNGKWTVA